MRSASWLALGGVEPWASPTCFLILTGPIPAIDRNPELAPA